MVVEFAHQICTCNDSPKTSAHLEFLVVFANCLLLFQMKGYYCSQKYTFLFALFLNDLQRLLEKENLQGLKTISEKS